MDWTKEGKFEFLDIREYRLKRFADNEKILAIEARSGLKLELGQGVYSNGRIFVPKDTFGIVVKIEIPGENGRTSDIIVVHFEGEQTPAHMKFEDLNFSHQGAI